MKLEGDMLWVYRGTWGVGGGNDIFILLDTYIKLPITKKNHNTNTTLMDTIVLWFVSS